MSGIRLVLMGFREAGKSWTGNIILGQQHFHRKTTVSCVKGEGEVDGRHVTIIKTPGWGKDHVRNTPELMKEELTLSVSLCPPGPHSVLLVMRAGMKFTETSRRAAQEHVELLGDDVWTHTIVLFTHGDWLGDSSIEQYIESEGKPLQWLVEKCGNRYHVFSDDKDNKVQVSELFNKVDETVTENSGYHFKIDERRLKGVEEKKSTEIKRAEEMKNKLLEQSNVMATQDDGKKSGQPVESESTTRPDISTDLMIVLLGHSNARKSSIGNSFLGDGKCLFESENILQSVKQQGEMEGRRITVINTPGWGPEQRLSETPELTRQEIILSVSSCDPGSLVLVLVIRVDGKFTELNRRAVQDHMDLLGPDVWEHTLLVVDGLDAVSLEEHIKGDDKSLKWLAEKCGSRYGFLEETDRPTEGALKSVDRVIAESGGRPYVMEGNLLKEVNEKRKGEEDRAKKRMVKVEKQWELKNVQEEDLSKRLEQMSIKGKPRIVTTTVKNLTSIPLPLDEFRIILLGHRGAGKTAAGNTILGSEAFKGRQSVQSVKKEARVAGRQITVIRASDWPKEQLLMDTPELTKQEIIQSLSMCSPGPHAVLVVINVRLKFTEASRRAVQEHLDLLSEKVWNHCMVLFTCEEWLGDLTIEQYIESEGKPLQWLIEKCGDRYHVLNYRSRRESSQVAELLQKIEHMVKRYGSHFEPDSDTLSKLKNVRNVERERADQRKMTVQKHRQNLQAKLNKKAIHCLKS